jgi:hypothetical protein
MPKLSPSQFEKAINTFESLPQQNRKMEMVSADFVDIIETITTFDHPLLRKLPMDRPKTVDDVAVMTAQAAFRLRLILQLIDDSHLTLTDRSPKV